MKHLKKSQKNTFAKSTERSILIKLTMYGHIYFWGKYEGKKPEERLSCSKKFNSSMMPSCFKVLQQKIKRVHLITRRWVSSTRAYLPNDNPEDFGWILSEDGSYKLKWSTEHVSPSVLEISIAEDRAWDSAEDFPEGMIIFSE